MRFTRDLAAPALALAVLGSAHPALAAGHGTMSTCAMFTASDASAVLGGKATRTMSHKIGLFTSCDYATPKPYQLIITQAATTATLAQQRHGATATSIFTQSRKAAGRTQAIKNLGDQAFYAQALDQVWVLKSDVVFNLTGNSDNGQLAESTLVKAAKRILKHLEPAKRSK
jgi:hypothetical protein